jgi:hypothetical protein
MLRRAGGKGNSHDNKIQAYEELGLLDFLTAIAAMPTARAEMNTSGADIITNGPQTNSGDRSGSWSAQQNVRDSERYEAVVRSNNSFRANRVQEECGPINDPQLHADCA